MPVNLTKKPEPEPEKVTQDAGEMTTLQPPVQNQSTEEGQMLTTTAQSMTIADNNMRLV